MTLFSLSLIAYDYGVAPAPDLAATATDNCYVAGLLLQQTASRNSRVAIRRTHVIQPSSNVTCRCNSCSDARKGIGRGQVNCHRLNNVNGRQRPLWLVPLFKSKTGMDVRVVAQGTGQALDAGRRGDADVVFVHAKEQEEKFLAEGYGVKRSPVMYNDFVLVGPTGDPAGIKNTSDIVAALRMIKDRQAPFVSRGDRSGTHQAELKLWQLAGIDIAKDRGPWYREIGQGMGATLNSAQAMEGYTISDRGTWISFKNKGDLTIMVEGDKRLFNQYGVMLVNPEKHPHVKKELGQQFVDWLVSAEGQRMIAYYKINGQQLFFPNANDPNA